jgi:amino acid transporter
VALLGTTAILLVQALAAFACIAYFHLHGRKHRDARWFRTLVAPLIGGLGMLYVIWLLVLNAGFGAGTAATDVVFQLSPWIVALARLGGMVFALVTRRFYPQRYELLGRVVLDARERRDMDTDELQVVRPRGGRHGA